MEDFKIELSPIYSCPYRSDIHIPSICVNDTITASTISGNDYDYIWVYDGMLIGTNSSVKFTRSTAQLKNLCLQVTHKVNKCIFSQCIPLQFVEKPMAKIELIDSFHQPLIICKNEEIRFKNKFINSHSAQYEWQILKANQILARYYTNEISHRFTVSGEIKVKLIITNCAQCVQIDEMNLTVEDKRAILISCPSVVCQDSQKIVRYTAMDSCSQFTWQVINGQIVAQQGNTLDVIWSEYPPDGFGYVILDASACDSTVCSQRTIVKVPILPTKGVDIVGPKLLCNPGRATYMMPKWPGAMYYWSVSPMDSVHIINSGANLSIVNIDFLKAGNYTISVRVEHPLAECSFTKELDVLVTLLSIEHRDTFCLDETKSFELTGLLNSPYEIIWTIYNPPFSKATSNTRLLDIQALDWKYTGSNTIYAKVMDKNGSCDVRSDFLVIKPPKDSIAGPRIICPDSSYLYSCNDPETEWDVRGGAVIQSSPTSREIQWNPSGPYFIKYRSKLAFCYSHWDSIEIQSHLSQESGITGPTEVCEDSRSRYKAMYSPKAIIQWLSLPDSIGSFQLINNNEIEVYWLAYKDSTATIRIQVSDCGMTYFDSLVVHINKRSKAIITALNLCQGNDAMFSVNANSSSYLWEFGDGETKTSNTNEASHRYKEPGIYTVRVYWDKGGDDCILGSYTLKEIEIIATESPRLSMVNLDTGEDMGCLTDDPVNVIIVASMPRSQNITRYSWYVGDSLYSDTGSTLTLYHAYPSSPTLCNDIKCIPHGVDCPGVGSIAVAPCSICDSECSPDITQISAKCARINFEGQFINWDDSCIVPDPPIGDKSLKGVWLIDGQIVKEIRRKIDLESQQFEVQEAGWHTLSLKAYMQGESDTTIVCGDTIGIYPKDALGNYPQDTFCELKVDTSILVKTVANFKGIFSCNGDQYKLRLKESLSYVPGLFDPNIYRWKNTETDVILGEGKEIEIVVNGGTEITILLEVLDTSNPNQIISCTKEQSFQAPDKLLAPIIIHNQVLCNKAFYDFKIGNDLKDIVEIHWDFGDGSESNQYQPSKLYDSPNTYIIKVTLENKYGCITESQDTILVKQNRISGYILIAPDTCKNIQLLYFQNTSQDPVSSYKWSTGSTDSFTYVNKDGQYMLEVTNPIGCYYKFSRTIKNQLQLAFLDTIKGPKQFCTNGALVKYTYRINRDTNLYRYEFSIETIPATIPITNYSMNNSSGTITITLNNLLGYKGSYLITVRAFRKGSNILCDELVYEFKANEAQIPYPKIDSTSIQCDPFSARLYDSLGRNIIWTDFNITSNEIIITKPGFIQTKLISIDGCISNKSILLDPLPDFSFFLSGCYERCDTTIYTNKLVIPGSADTRKYKKWAYIQDDNVILSGQNSVVGDLHLGVENEGKIYLVLENYLGCKDTSEAFCLVIKYCRDTFVCDSLHILYDSITVIKDSINCVNGEQYFTIKAELATNPITDICAPNPILITNAVWTKPVQARRNGGKWILDQGQFKLSKEQCESVTKATIKLCYNNIECDVDIPFTLDCTDDCFDCSVVPNFSCPHIYIQQVSFDCASQSGFYTINGELAAPSGWSICSPNPIELDSLVWDELPTVTQNPLYPQLFTITGGKFKIPLNQCTGSLKVRIRLCKGATVCKKEYVWPFACYGQGQCYDEQVTIQLNGEGPSIKMNITGMVDNILNCNPTYPYLRAVLYYWPQCTQMIAQKTITKPQYGESYNFDFTLFPPIQTCYCVRLFYCTALIGGNCIPACTFNSCNGYYGDLRTGTDGNINTNITCVENNPIAGLNSYNFNINYGGTGTGVIIDSLNIITNNISINGISKTNGELNGSFTLPDTISNINFEIFVGNQNYSESTVIVLGNSTLPPCGQISNQRSRTVFNYDLQITPNPSNESTIVNYKYNKDCKKCYLRLFNYSGEEITIKTPCDLSNKLEINTSKYAEGIYVVVLEEDGIFRSMERLVIMR